MMSDYCQVDLAIGDRDASVAVITVTGNLNGLPKLGWLVLFCE